MGYISEDARVENSKLSNGIKIYSRALVRCSELAEGVSVGDETIIAASQIGDHCELDRRNYIHHAAIGSFTYTGWNTYIGYTDIGRFCSISRSVDIGGAEHNYRNVTTMPIEKLEQMKSGLRPVWNETGRVHIGNDVWIGQGAAVLRKKGIHIGDGAVIAAGAVVCGDVGPYEIWGGVPARFIKYRFEKEWIERLLEVAWWDFPLDVIERNCEIFQREMSEELTEYLENLSKRGR